MMIHILLFNNVRGRNSLVRMELGKTVNRWSLRKIHEISASSTSPFGLIQKQCAVKDCSFISDEEKSEFESVYPQLMEDVVNESREACSPTLSRHVEEMFRYNVGSGTNFRGLAAMKAYKLMEKPEKLTPENVKLACIMGWLIELSGGAVTMSDDVVDGSRYRRGYPAWHTRKEIGLNSVNDAILLNTAYYFLLTKYFEQLPCYRSFLRVFNRVNMKGNLGLIMDCLPSRRTDWDLFTVEKCLHKIRMAAAYAAFAWGIELAMLFANINEPYLITKSNSVTIDMGIYYQLLNDYSDCYVGGLDRSGKPRSDDIRCRKLTWPAAKALELCTPSQRKIFTENYGKNEEDTVEIIHRLYDDLNMQERYQEFLNSTLRKIEDDIHKLPAELPRQFYMDLMGQVVHSDPL